MRLRGGMKMNDEKMKILEMIAAGKISPGEGADLLKALEQDPDSPGPARWLYIRVTEFDSGKVHKIKVPVGWAGKLVKFGTRFVPKADFDLEEIYEAIRSGAPGQVLEVDADDGTRVEIWLEV